MSILDKAKETAEALVDKVKDKLDQKDASHDSPSDESTAAPESDDTGSGAGDGAVTPADVAQAVSDPNLAHPTPPGEDPAP